MRNKTGKYQICPICHKRFYVFPYLINKRIYCSRKCCTTAKREKFKPVYYNKHFRKGKYKICRYCGKSYYCEKYRLKTSLFCSRSCLGKSKKGKKASNWQGGIYPENSRIRKSEEYTHWRKKVFERDNYTCQKCGQKGGKLHAHHIKSFADYPKFRFVVSNGITYCEKCHYEMPHSWHGNRYIHAKVIGHC